jgi:hypothetical protein
VKPMKITILTIGSRGDVQPFVALGRGLQAAGHSPRSIPSSLTRTHTYSHVHSHIRRRQCETHEDHDSHDRVTRRRSALRGARQGPPGGGSFSLLFLFLTHTHSLTRTRSHVHSLTRPLTHTYAGGNVKPMKITILTIGSRGDVQPFVPLGRGLQAAGHSPRSTSYALTHTHTPTHSHVHSLTHTQEAM